MIINFSKPITLYYKDEYLHYNSANKAIEELYERFNNEFSKDFIKYMIRSGELKIENWFDFYKTNYNKNYKQIKENGLKKNTKLLKKVLERNNLITQNDVYAKTKLDELTYYGICLMTSIWNCYPFMFKYSIQILKDILEKIKDDDKNFKDPVYVVDYINDCFKDAAFGNNIIDLYQTMNGSEIDHLIIRSINNERPVVLGLLNEKLQKDDGHAVSILGYDEYNYYLFDNETYQNKYSQVKNYLIKACKENVLSEFYKIKDDKEKLRHWILKLEKIGFEKLPKLVIDGKNFDKEITDKIKIKDKYIMIDKQLIWYSVNWCDVLYLTPEFDNIRTKKHFDFKVLTNKLDKLNEKLLRDKRLQNLGHFKTTYSI